MFKTWLMAATIAFSGTVGWAATYNPVGVHNDVLVTDVLDGGWSIIHSETFGTRGTTMAELFDGAGSHIMLATRRVGARSFDVLAAIETAVYVPLYTARNRTILSNGARWYKNGGSMGFAGATDTIRQSSADVNGQSERDRISWHTRGGYNNAATSLSGGWRSGDNLWLNNTSAWERVILTATPSAAVLPVPLPAGLPLLLGGLAGLFVLRRRQRG